MLSFTENTIIHRINPTTTAVFEVLILNQPLVSPSLWKPENTNNNAQNAFPAATGAFEIKFLIDEALVKPLISVVSTGMQLDPHSNPETGGYSVEGIYFDTASHDVFRRTPGYSRRKYRIRRYSQGPSVFLERKAKRKGIVTKRRIQIEESRLSHVLLNQPINESHPEIALPNVAAVDARNEPTDMKWFCKRIDRMKLQPTLCIAYDRIAYLAMENLGPIRLTIDRGISCCAFDQLSFPSRASYQHILDGKCILELKFRETLPIAFREIIDSFQLMSQSVSKFRNAFQACGLSPRVDPLTSEGEN